MHNSGHRSPLMKKEVIYVLILIWTKKGLALSVMLGRNLGFSNKGKYLLLTFNLLPLI